MGNIQVYSGLQPASELRRRLRVRKSREEDERQGKGEKKRKMSLQYINLKQRSH